MVTAAAQRPVPVRGGPVAYRLALRRLGPFVALLLPLAIAGLACLIWNGSAGIRPALVVWMLAALAMPTAVLVGLPLFTTTTTLWAGVATSTAVWIVMGRYAAQRATASPVATWRDFWRELAVLALAMWGGIGAGVAAMAFVLSR